MLHLPLSWWNSLTMSCVCQGNSRFVALPEKFLIVPAYFSYCLPLSDTRFLSSSSDCSKPFITTATSLRTRRSRRVSSVYWRTAVAKEKNCRIGYFRLLSVSAIRNEHHRSTTLVARRSFSDFSIARSFCI